MFRVDSNKKGGLFVPGVAPLGGGGRGRGVLYRILLRRDLGGSIPCEVNKTGGLFVPGEAPLVYYIGFLWSRFGCIPCGGE